MRTVKVTNVAAGRFQIEGHRQLYYDPVALGIPHPEVGQEISWPPESTKLKIEIGTPSYRTYRDEGGRVITEVAVPLGGVDFEIGGEK